MNDIIKLVELNLLPKIPLITFDKLQFYVINKMEIKMHKCLSNKKVSFFNEKNTLEIVYVKVANVWNRS